MQDQAQKVRANLKYLRLLAKDYPNIAEASSEIINLQAVLKLPKGTEHFMSDLHGEYDAFTHILIPGSEIAGIKEKAAGSERLVLSDPGVANRGMPAGVFQAHPKVRALQSTQGL